MSICIFPGTFNPIHQAHIKMAEFALEHYGFDKIIFIPSYIPPHKALNKDLAVHRLNMVKIAISSNPKFELSDIEYNILRLLMKYPGKIFSAQNLYESVWNEPYFYNCNSTVMVHIRRLRVKIEEDSKNPKLILTVWGKGYRFGEH